jgi:hypothetical protein
VPDQVPVDRHVPAAALHRPPLLHAVARLGRRAAAAVRPAAGGVERVGVAPLGARGATPVAGARRPSGLAAGPLAVGAFAARGRSAARRHEGLGPPRRAAARTGRRRVGRCRRRGLTGARGRGRAHARLGLGDGPRRDVGALEAAALALGDHPVRVEAAVEDRRVVPEHRGGRTRVDGEHDRAGAVARRVDRLRDMGARLGGERHCGVEREVRGRGGPRVAPGLGDRRQVVVLFRRPTGLADGLALKELRYASVLAIRPRKTVPPFPARAAGTRR